MSTEPEHHDRIVSRLLDEADLPRCVAVEDISQWGLDHEVRRARLSDGRDVVVRYRPRCAEPARMITALLEAHDIPAPQLSAASSEAMLHEFIPGSTLGEVLDDGQCSPETWAAIRQKPSPPGKGLDRLAG